MKARLFMARLLAVVMLLNSVLPAYASVNTLAGAGEPTIVETLIDGDSAEYAIATDTDAEEITELIEMEMDASNLPDDEELLNGFIENLFQEEISGESALFGDFGVGRLKGVNKYVYNEMKDVFSKIAAGKVSSPTVTIDMSGEWTAEELGLDSVVIDTLTADANTAFKSAVTHAMDLLLMNCPYELYWMDKTEETTIGLSYYPASYNDDIITTDGTLTISFHVSEDYKIVDENDVVSVDTVKVASAIAAKENAIELYEYAESLNLSKFEMAEMFKWEICGLVDYDHDAAANNPPYGDPWQMVYVFDDDPDTMVVCEGYSKAFQYLCDLAKIECYTVTGTMGVSASSDAENHMWNIVTFGGKNYLVDVTNCDGVEDDVVTNDAIGFPNNLFLPGAEGSVKDGYTVTIRDAETNVLIETVIYKYSDKTKALYADEDILTLANKSYYDALDDGEVPSWHKYWSNVVSGGQWMENSDGNFTYIKVDGTQAYDCLVETNGSISYINEEGFMVTGFCELVEDVCYFDDKGFMVRSTTRKISGDYCTFNDDGILIEDPPYEIRRHPGNQVGAPGTMVTFEIEVRKDKDISPYLQWQFRDDSTDDGWLPIEDGDADRNPETFELEVDEVNCNFRYRCVVSGDPSGLVLKSNPAKIVATGWVEYADGKFQYYKDGVMLTDWYTEGERTFYFAVADDAEADLYIGDMVTGVYVIDGKMYYFAEKDDDKYVHGQMWIDGTVWDSGILYNVSADGTLTATESELEILEHPSSYWGQDDKIQLTVKAVGVKFYQWFYRENSEKEWQMVPETVAAGATTETLTVLDTDASTGFEFYCKLENADGEVLETERVSVHYTPVPVVQGIWKETENGWQCVDEDGDTYEYKFAVFEGKVCFVGEDGFRVYNEYLEHSYDGKSDWYYVDSNGVLVTNSWRQITVDDKTHWVYLSGSGRAVTSAKKQFGEGENARVYAFDYHGYMMTGWVNFVKDTTTGKSKPEYASDWKTASYYFSESEDVDLMGIRASGMTTIKVDENEEHTFYFSESDGSKVVSELRVIEDKQYYFDATGAMWTNKQNVELVEGFFFNIDENGVVTPVKEGGGTGEGSGGSLAPNEFADMTRLQALITEGELHDLNYAGESAFRISETLTVPSGVNLHFQGKNVEVCEGVTFTLNSMMECGSLDVHGTMIANSYFNAGSSLKVTGRLERPNGNIGVNYPAEIIGINKISFGDVNQEYKWMKVAMEARVDTVSELESLVQEIPTDEYYNQNRVGYNLQLTGNHENFEINKNIEIPEKTVLELSNAAAVTIVKDYTLTNKGELRALIPLKVNGTLNNSGTLSITNQGDFAGTIMLDQNGTYSGNGEFQVHTDESVSDLTQILFGFNLDEMYFHKNTENNGDTHWHLDRSGMTFGTFEQLEAILNGQPSGKCLMYAGTAPFEIKDDLTIPANVTLDMNRQDLRVLSGVEFTLNEQIFSCKNLLVEGTMNALSRISVDSSICVSGILNSRNGMNAGSKLDVTESGRLILERGNIRITYPGELYGLDRIEFKSDSAKIRFSAEFTTSSGLALLAEKLADQNNYISHAHVKYVLSTPYNDEESMTTTVIQNTVTIPAHVQLQVDYNQKLVIGAGAAVTIEGSAYVAGALEVNGSLVNNGRISVCNYPDNPEYEELGTITLSSGDNYTGNGQIAVDADSGVSDITAVLSGFNMDNYDISEEANGDGFKTWTLRSSAGLTKLGTPKNLKWGTEYREEWIPLEGSDDEYKVILHELERSGAMSWETVDPDQAEIQIQIYLEGETTPCHSERIGFSEDYQPEFRSVNSFRVADLDSGTYYFTVQSLGDYVKYSNSDVATSGLYTYVKPSERLDRLTGLQWVNKDDQFVSWIDWEDYPNSENRDGYQIKMYYSDTVDGDYRQYDGVRGYGNLNSENPMDDHFFQEKGDGYYKFKVRALSKDIEQVGNGRWSELSPVFDTTSTTEEVNEDLTDIIDNVANGTTVTQDAILNEVQTNMDTEDLKAALLVDQDNSGATEKLAELEDKVGGAVPPLVTPEAPAFDPTEVSVVGANLNKADASAAPIQLVVDEPKEDHVIPELYNSSIAVSFSMTLDNVEDPKNLAVPVKVTLPVPNSIIPQFLVVIHYDAEGEPEIIRPYVYQKAGKWYADFVLTSFSDFVMTNIHELERMEAKEATETSKGNIEHYVCDVCGGLFADADAKEKLTIDEVELPKLSHDCRWDKGVVVTPSTCTTKGKMKYTCTVAGCGDVRYEDIPAGHKLEKVAGKEATKTSTGNIEHYKCTVCSKLFNNASAGKELTIANVTIPKKTGSPSGGGGGGGASSGGKKKPTTTVSAGIANLPSYVVTGQWTVVDGKWGFTDNSGLVYKNKWAAVHNPYANLAAGQAAFDWFFFDVNGQMASGWVLDAGHWYYLNPVSDGTQGRMLIGWQQINGQWYYLNPISDGTKGAMITNTWIDGCYLDANGVWDQTKTK